MKKEKRETWVKEKREFIQKNTEIKNISNTLSGFYSHEVKKRERGNKRNPNSYPFGHLAVLMSYPYGWDL